MSERGANLPPEQEAIRAKCFHPSGTFVEFPKEPEYPGERLAFMLADAHVSILPTQEGLLGHGGSRTDDSDCRSSILDGTIQRVCLDRDWELIARKSDTNPENSTTADNLACVIYTSRSTGQPKGVQITHKSLLNRVVWHHQAFSLTPFDRATQLAGPGFDAAVWELCPYLTVGASIHIPDEMTRLGAASLRNLLVGQAITISFVPTGLAESLVTLDWPQQTALRILLTGGDTLHVYPPETLPFRVFNNYGPTECTVVTTSGQVWPNAHPVHPPTIGRPIANTQVYIFDAQRNPVPIGVVEEIYIGGDGIARGYLNRPQLTAERFIYHSFDEEPEQRLYKTGDRARYLQDGNIEFVGRIDDQVKIRGYRIELGEIQCGLRHHPGIEHSVAVAREDDPGDRRLVAYCVATPGYALNIDDATRFLRTKLPEYMIPAAWVTLPWLPRLPNGKVDRASLPPQEKIKPERLDVISAAWTPLEKLLAQVWAEVLKSTTPFGIDNNFFELGGHSLLATRLGKVLNTEIPLRFLFEAPTIRELALRVEVHHEERLPGGEILSELEFPTEEVTQSII